MQYVKVDLDGRAYTYSWPGEPLRRGDWVVVPGNVVNPRSQIAQVIRVLKGPDYDGEITQILDVSHHLDLL